MSLLDILQVVGAVAILVPYLLTLFGTLSQTNFSYLVANMLGAGLLAALAVVGEDWGFLLLEGSWALAASYRLLRLGQEQRTTR